MALLYTVPTALSQFSFVQFKAVMGIADIDEPTYSLILKSIFDILNTQYDIDINASTALTLTHDMVYAIYRHAKFIFEMQSKNLDVVDTVADASGNRTSFKVKVPTDVLSTYKMYSPILPALL